MMFGGRAGEGICPHPPWSTRGGPTPGVCGSFGLVVETSLMRFRDGAGNKSRLTRGSSQGGEIHIVEKKGVRNVKLATQGRKGVRGGGGGPFLDQRRGGG